LYLGICVAQANAFIKAAMHRAHSCRMGRERPVNFDMNRTWSQATAMVGANMQYLALIAGIFFLLPNMVLVVALPDMMGTLLTPGGDPEQMAAQLTAQIPALAGVVLFGSLFSIVGYAAMVDLLGPGRPTVGESLRAALGALPTLIGCVLVSVLGYALFAIAFALAIGLVSAALGMVLGETAAGAIAVIGVVVMVGALITVALRFVLVIPAVMLEGTRNPLTAFGRSWKLTGQSRRRIVLFFVLLFIAYMVLSMLLFSVVGLIGNLFVTGLVNGLAGAAVAMLLTAILVSMHQQLSGLGQGAADVFE
jgi:hypothetical protein